MHIQIKCKTTVIGTREQQSESDLGLGVRMAIVRLGIYLSGASHEGPHTVRIQVIGEHTMHCKYI